jgi:hypothetical protein
MAVLADFDCSPKVAAIYQPGPNWSQFRERLPEHLDFVKARLDAKVMAFGSPMTDRSGQPIGGLFVYNDPDLAVIEKLLQDDTFVRNLVVTYSLARWGMCTSKTPVK